MKVQSALKNDIATLPTMASEIELPSKTNTHTTMASHGDGSDIGKEQSKSVSVPVK